MLSMAGEIGLEIAHLMVARDFLKGQINGGYFQGDQNIWNGSAEGADITEEIAGSKE